MDRSETLQRMEAFKPRLANASPSLQRREAFRDTLPKGATFAVGNPRTASHSKFATFNPSMMDGFQGGGGNTMYSVERPYLPEFECFLKGTPVILADGTRKPVEDVRVGDKVLDRTGAVQTVERQWCSGVPDNLIELVLWGGKKFLSTEHHRWPVWSWARVCQCGCGEPVTQGRLYVQDHYKKGMPEGVRVKGSSRTSSSYKAIPSGYDPLQKIGAADVAVGDFLLMPRKFDYVASDVTEDLARLLGYYVAEGNLTYSKSGALYAAEMTFNFAVLPTWAEDARRITEGLDVPCSLTSDESRGVVRYRTTNDRGRSSAARDLVSFFASHGGSLASEKRFSADVMQWNVRLKRELIKGLFRGDGSQTWRFSEKCGSKGKAFGVNYSTVSRELASQVQLILAQLGFPSRFHIHGAEVRELNGKSCSCAEIYNLVIPAPYSFDLADLIWVGESKSSDYTYENNMGSPCMMDDDFVYLPVKGVNIVANSLPVYNLTVSGDHSYLVDNIATYNSQDRVQFPVTRQEQNRYWRMFHMLDPLFGTAMEMYSEMMVSDFDIEVEETTDKSIDDAVKAMCDRIHFTEKLKQMAREFLVVGEVVPHLFFDDDEGMWSYLAMHNPDFIEIKDSPLVNMDPIISFVPDQQLVSLFSDRSPEALEMRQNLPSEFVAKILARQPIRLSSSNCSFIARKMSPYDTRGTSIATRMWRIWMVEDSVFSSTIATYRRHASPIKVAKLGDPSTGWIPSPDQEAELLSMLKQCEQDPNAWLCYHYGVQFEAWGTTERAITIKGEHDVIERLKLLALGLSKSFMSGEVSFASAKSGLQVFLRRLLTFRQFWESMWIYPKLLKPISIANDWVKSKPNEVDHGYRVKRTAQEAEDENLLIIPRIRWHNELDSTVNSDLLSAYMQMEKFRFPVSQSSVGAVVDLDWQNELRKKAEEWKNAHEIVESILGRDMAAKFWAEQESGKKGASPAGGPGAGAKPPGAAGKPPGGAKPDASNPPGSGEAGEPETEIETPAEGAMVDEM